MLNPTTFKVGELRHFRHLLGESNRSGPIAVGIGMAGIEPTTSRPPDERSPSELHSVIDRLPATVKEIDLTLQLKL